MTSSAPHPSLTNHQIGEISHALRLALTGLPAGVKATFRLRTQRRRLLQPETSAVVAVFVTVQSASETEPDSRLEPRATNDPHGRPLERAAHTPESEGRNSVPSPPCGVESERGFGATADLNDRRQEGDLPMPPSQGTAAFEADPNAVTGDHALQAPVAGNAAAAGRYFYEREQLDSREVAGAVKWVYRCECCAVNADYYNRRMGRTPRRCSYCGEALEFTGVLLESGSMWPEEIVDNHPGIAEAIYQANLIGNGLRHQEANA